jgi:hypothetical protein
MASQKDALSYLLTLWHGGVMRPGHAINRRRRRLLLIIATWLCWRRGRRPTATTTTGVGVVVAVGSLAGVVVFTGENVEIPALFDLPS